MNRKPAAISISVLSCLGVVGAGMAWSLSYQPTFYQTALSVSAPPEVRREQAKVFVQSTLQLVDGIRNEDRWAHEFTEDAVNGWLAEELPAKYARWLPPNVSSPRVRFEKGTLLLAFQTRRGMWSGVVSGRVRPWVAGPNQLAIEIQSARIGLFPVPVEDILGDFVKNMNGAGWRLEWKTSGKQDVLVVNLDGNPSAAVGERPVLETVDLAPKTLSISGRRSTEIAANPAAASPVPRVVQRPE